MSNTIPLILFFSFIITIIILIIIHFSIQNHKDPFNKNETMIISYIPNNLNPNNFTSNFKQEINNYTLIPFTLETNYSFYSKINDTIKPFPTLNINDINNFFLYYIFTNSEWQNFYLLLDYINLSILNKIETPYPEFILYFNSYIDAFYSFTKKHKIKNMFELSNKLYTQTYTDSQKKDFIKSNSEIKLDNPELDFFMTYTNINLIYKDLLSTIPRNVDKTFLSTFKLLPKISNITTSNNEIFNFIDLITSSYNPLAIDFFKDNTLISSKAKLIEITHFGKNPQQLNINMLKRHIEFNTYPYTNISIQKPSDESKGYFIKYVEQNQPVKVQPSIYVQPPVQAQQSKSFCSIL